MMLKIPTYALTWIALGLSATSAFAAAAGGGGMPWDAPLTNVQTDLSGPTASTVALIAMVGVFGVLIFGGEISHFVRTLSFIILAAATLVAGNTFFTSIGITGATVGGGETGYLVCLSIVSGCVSVGLWEFAKFLRRKHLLARQSRVALVDR